MAKPASSRSTKPGVTPAHFALFEAIRNGRFRQAQLLVEGGADVNGRNDKGDTPLITACTSVEDPRTRSRLCQLLITAHADVNAVDSHGQTALMHSVILGCGENVNALLNKEQIDVGVQDDQGNTALMYAAIFGHEDIARCLLNPPGKTCAACRPNVRNFAGLTAADIAKNKGNHKLQLILCVTKRKEKPFWRQSKNGCSFLVDTDNDSIDVDDDSEKEFIPRQLHLIRRQESDAQPPGRPPTPAHIYLLPSLDLNESQSSIKSDPGECGHQQRSAMRRKESGINRARSEPRVPSRLEVIELTGEEEKEKMDNDNTDTRLPPIVRSMVKIGSSRKETRSGQRKSLKRKKGGDNIGIPVI